MSWLSEAWHWYAAERLSQSGAVDHPHAALINPIGAGVVGVATAVGALFLVKVALQQAQTARERHREQTKADRDRRITESFSKAIEQLGNDKVVVCLGGIYTLERISRESPDDYYWTVMETLCAFVRERARWSKPDETSSEAALMNRAQPPTDIAAVLAIIVRRDERQSEGDLDFRGANLGGADFYGACLHGAYLSRTNLSGACFHEADLSMADFCEADLSGADFSEADLSGATFDKADHLCTADLRGAVLRGAYLSGTNLSGVDLPGSNLSKANLSGAVLNGVNLAGADLRGADLAGADLRDADLGGTDLRGADLREADLYGANLDNARGDAQTKLPNGFARPASWPAPT